MAVLPVLTPQERSEALLRTLEQDARDLIDRNQMAVSRLVLGGGLTSGTLRRLGRVSAGLTTTDVILQSALDPVWGDESDHQAHST